MKWLVLEHVLANNFDIILSLRLISYQMQLELAYIITGLQRVLYRPNNLSFNFLPNSARFASLVYNKHYIIVRYYLQILHASDLLTLRSTYPPTQYAPQ